MFMLGGLGLVLLCVFGRMAGLSWKFILGMVVPYVLFCVALNFLSVL